MKLRKSLYIIFGFLLIQNGVAQSQFMYNLKFHYESINTGPYTYLEAGDSIYFNYDHTFGAYDLFLVQYTGENQISAEPLKLKSGINGNIKLTYKIDFTGCYQPRIVPDPKFRYAHGSLDVYVKRKGSSNSSLPHTCILNFDTQYLNMGDEIFIEEGLLTGSRTSLILSKKVTSNGIATLTTTLKIEKGETVITSINANKQDPRINLLIKKTDNINNTIIYRTFQHQDTIAYKSLSGGEYSIQFWGRDIFKRESEVQVEIIK